MPPANPASAQVPIHRFTAEKSITTSDHLAIEEPLEIRLAFGPRDNRTTKPIAITMRTPTRLDQPTVTTHHPHDFELAVGLLLAEGILHFPADIEHILYCGPEIAPLRIHNVVRIELSPAIPFDLARLERRFITNSSCGICGKTTLDALRTLHPTPLSSDLMITPDLLHALPELLRPAQNVFDATGGLHAAALFDATGRMIALREDIGRHNAVDKVIGSQFLADTLPLSQRILLVSGRASFELLQKSIMAGIAVFAAVGAPSSLAVDIAKQFNITLVGFLRNNRFNVYCGEQRVAAPLAARSLS